MIAVKGMKMPQKCEICRFNLGGMCMATEDRREIHFDGRKQSWCPLKRVETLQSMQIVDEYMITHMPDEIMEREVRGSLKGGLMRAVDRLPGAVTILREDDFDAGTRFRAAMQVVIADDV